MNSRFEIDTALLLLKMRLLISLEFNVKLELHGDDALTGFFYYGTRSCHDRLKQLSNELEQHTRGECSPTAAFC